MTIQQDAPAGEPRPPAGHRAVGERRRLAALWGVVAVLAAGGVWVVATPHHKDGTPGATPSGSGTAAAVLPGQPAPPLTESQSFNAERYFPVQRAYDLEAYRAHRTAARDGADCLAVQRDKAHDVLDALDCKGWLGIALTRTDPAVITSVTVLRFADAAAAAKAVQAVRDHAAAFEFTYPDGLFAPAEGVKPMAATRVDLVGHHITLTVSRYADQRTGNGPDGVLTDSTRYAASLAGQPFMWM
ncbi:hypothetical protein [Streptomyces sp. TLI_171]|uniref:hypothetical protein n=1 Tax=Streptomyces sp. TLI_171 TaxID=1938859 RepID=UPI000C18D793|nr:hypothetical protein [Streptomyces sp. TLI_171]RKE23097.1 hypothetical protein BX266_6554 [Streptomyces sp. TLI_171]